MRKIYQKKKNSQLFYDFSKRYDVRHDKKGNKKRSIERRINGDIKVGQATPDVKKESLSGRT